MKRLLLIICILYFFVPPPVRGDLYEERLDRGLSNSEDYASFLIEKAEAHPGDAKKLLNEALRYSPDLPAVYFELAKVNFSLSVEGLSRSFYYLIEGIVAYERNFWWFFTMVGTLVMSVILSFVLSIVVVIVIRLIQNVPLLSHDTEEQKTKLALFLLLILSLAGPLWLVGGMLCILGLYMEKWDRAVVYLYLLFLLFSPLIFKTTSIYINAPASHALKAVIMVNESKENRYALSVLGNNNDRVARFSYALALKREGKYDDAIAVYSRLIEKNPDARAYNNMANCYVAKNDIERAKKLYEKSIEIMPLATSLYNLSQVSRLTRDYPRGEKYFSSAQKLDPEAISRFQARWSWNPNRFVIDEVLPLSTLLKYAAENPTSISTMGLSALPQTVMPVIALLLAILFYILDRNIKSRAYRCRKCGTIFCSRCEKHLWGRMCQKCFSSLVKLNELDTKERIARLQEVHNYQIRRRMKVKALSFILPGSAQIYGGDILRGFLFLWPFLFLLCFIAVGSVFMKGVLHFSPLWLNMGSLLFLGIVYITSVMVVRRRLAKRWL